MEKHIIFDSERFELLLLDQRLLPGEEKFLSCGDYRDVIAAIKDMAVRGAPAIGVAAAYGCVLAARNLASEERWEEKLARALDELAIARPTAVNLAWAVNRMRKIMERATPAELVEAWLAEAREIDAEDQRTCAMIGKNGATLLKDGDTVLTHCNAGALATAGFGTALGVIRAAVAEGKKIKVIADETRPLLQGARLTAWELQKDGIEVMLACDSSCALLLQKGFAQIVITGADRVAANGDAANKIGTLGVAIIAKYFNIPFYIACPLSTIDTATTDGAQITLEARPGREVTHVGGAAIAPENTQAYNFAFDVTPASLINGIITETGILRPPYGDSIRRAFAMAAGYAGNTGKTSPSSL